MVYTETNRKSIQKWRVNNKEKFNEYNTNYVREYRQTRREEYNEYMRSLQKRLKERRDYFDYDKWAKILLKIVI